MYSKFPHIRTYQNKNLEAVFPKLCTLQLRTCFSLMKHRFLLQELQSSSLIVVVKVIVVPVCFKSLFSSPITYYVHKNASKTNNRAEHLCETLKRTNEAPFK